MPGRKSLIETFPSVDRALARVQERVRLLVRAERRVGRVLAPYAAAVIQEGVRLHLAGREDPRGWKRLLEKHGIRVKADAISPLQAVAKLVFAESPRGSIGRYAAAMAWAYERVRRGFIQVDEIAAHVVREGGVVAVAQAWVEQRGGEKRVRIDKAIYEAVLDNLPTAGFLSVSDPDVELAREVLAIIRTDRNRRSRVIVLDQDPGRVRKTVVRYARRKKLARTA